MTFVILSSSGGHMPRQFINPKYMKLHFTRRSSGQGSGVSKVEGSTDGGKAVLIGF
jgi:hypothetical protein